MHRSSATLVPIALMVVLAATGCGTDDGPDRATGSPTGSPTQSTTPPDDPTDDPTTPPSDGLQKTRIVGEVVEDGDCVVVRDDNATTWTITGDGTARLAVGDRVAVTGAPDLTATGCGGPLVRVTSIRAVS